MAYIYNIYNKFACQTVTKKKTEHGQNCPLEVELKKSHNQDFIHKLLSLDLDVTVIDYESLS